MKKTIFCSLLIASALATAPFAQAAVHFDNDTKGSTMFVKTSSGIKEVEPNKLKTFKGSNFNVTVHRQTVPTPMLSACKFRNLPHGTVIKSSNILNGSHQPCVLRKGML